MCCKYVEIFWIFLKLLWYILFASVPSHPLFPTTEDQGRVVVSPLFLNFRTIRPGCGRGFPFIIAFRIVGPSRSTSASPIYTLYIGQERQK